MAVLINGVYKSDLSGLVWETLSIDRYAAERSKVDKGALKVLESDS
jgi:hypothetical protein